MADYNDRPDTDDTDSDLLELCFARQPAPAGRIVDGGKVLLRPYAGPQAREEMPKLQAYEPPVQPVPLQLLLAAATLISDQPTTEQWKTIKEAIRALVPSPIRS